LAQEDFSSSWTKLKQARPILAQGLEQSSSWVPLAALTRAFHLVER